MKLHSLQTDEVSLSGFGEEARAMLLSHDFAALANRFGYALAFDRDPSGAIEADFLNAVASPYEVAAGAGPSTKVKYFSPNDTGLFAVVECVIPVADKAAILLDLIVTSNGEQKYITVEDISGVGT
jgi:hypothetical protein